jgi:hypothetical protein
VPEYTGRQRALPRNGGRLAADYSASAGKITPAAARLKPHSTHAAVSLLSTAMVRSVLLHVQGHETRSHADLTDRDRDESSRRAISARVRTNPQTQVR